MDKVISHKLSLCGDCQGPGMEDIFLLGSALDNAVDFVGSCEPAGKIVRLAAGISFQEIVERAIDHFD